MLHIALCDDHVNELAELQRLLLDYKQARGFAFDYALFESGFELITALERGKRFDIYCLDIIMPGITGIEVAKEIRAFDKTAPIIFLTSSPEYALDGYSVRAINYVLKPMTREKLFRALDDVFEHIKVNHDDAAVIVKSSDGIQKILISNLVYAEVMGRSVLYHLVSGKVIECTESFSSVCDNLLKYGCFVKPHRSYLVNMRYIDTIESNRLTLQSKETVPVAQGKAREIKQNYLSYQMEEE